MKIGNALLLVVALIGAYVAGFRPAIIVQLVAQGFSLAAVLLFPVLVLGIWDRRINKQSAIAGTVVGLAVTIIYLYLSRFKNIELFSMPPNFIVALVVSRLTPPPPQNIQEFVDNIRYPKSAEE